MNQPQVSGLRRLFANTGLGLALATASVSPSTAQDGSLHWPTDAGHCVTSTFCEFRPDHFHSGLDISTWGKVGYGCFAVGDGEISRVRVSCGGYGRSIYLRLRDGRTAVYAHLSRFAGALADTVQAMQVRAGDAYFDREFAPGTFPVGRGDLLGYTGQSGVGVPHLHVEIRDRKERPLDPLTAGLHVPDTIPPSLLRVALTPLNAASSVDGLSDTVILDVHPGASPAEGRIPRTIPVEGEIGLAVEVDDTTDGCRFRLAPRRVELFEGEELLHGIDYSRFAFSQTSLMDLQIDPRFSYSKVGRFHNLWRRAGNELPFFDPAAKGDGILRARQIALAERSFRRTPESESFPILSSVQREGERVRSLTIVVHDSAGNRGTARIDLSFAPAPVLSVLTARLFRTEASWATDEADLEEAWADTMIVDGAVRASGRPLRDVELEVSFDRGSTWFDAPRVIPDPDHSFRARFPVLGRIPGHGRGEVLLRGRAVDVLGAFGLARTVAMEGSSAPSLELVRPEIVTQGPWVELRFDDAVTWSALSGGWDGDDAVLVRPWGRGVRVARAPAEPGESQRDWSGTSSPFRAFDPWGRPREFVVELPERVVPRAIVEGSRFAYRFPPSTFAEPVAVNVREEPAPLPASELRSLGPLHFLETGQVPLTGSYEVILRSEQTVAHDPERVGIFVHDGDRFRYIGGDPDPETGGWSTRARTLLGIGLFEDATPPVFGEPRLETSHGRVRLSFQAEDAGSGIDCDAVEVLFDGNPIPHELDDETGDVVAYPPVPVEAGAGGAFDLRCVDRCGNPARRSVTLRLP